MLRTEDERNIPKRQPALQVPDTWHVINSQDVVVHGMKMHGLYKRNGNRVIIHENGDMVVRPAHLELSLLQERFPASHRCRRSTSRPDRCLDARRSLRRRAIVRCR